MSKPVHRLIGLFPNTLGFSAPFRDNRSPAHIPVYFTGAALRDLTGVDSASASRDSAPLGCYPARQ